MTLEEVKKIIKLNGTCKLARPCWEKTIFVSDDFLNNNLGVPYRCIEIDETYSDFEITQALHYK